MNITIHLRAASKTPRSEKQDGLKQTAKETFQRKWVTDWTKQSIKASKTWQQENKEPVGIIRPWDKETEASE